MHFQTKGEQATQQLRDILLEGRWDNILPGYRILCQELGVSRIYIEEALTNLTTEGLLAPAERGKARRITAEAKKGNRAGGLKKKVVLIIGSCPWDDLPFATLEVLRKIREHASIENVHLTYTSINMIGRQKLGAHVDRLVRDFQASHLLLVTPTESLVMYASRKKLPYFCLGGEIPKEAGKCDAAFVTIEEMIRPAVIYLASRGHSKILCPMQLGREMSRNLLWKLLQQETRLQMTKDIFNTSFPVQDMTRHDVLFPFWQKQYAQNQPTAVILHDFSELLSFHQFCITHRLSIPLDVSIVALFDHPSIPWISPTLSRFIVPTQKMTRLIIKWMGRDIHDPQGTVQVPPKAIEGTTVADLRSINITT